MKKEDNTLIEKAALLWWNNFNSKEQKDLTKKYFHLTGCNKHYFLTIPNTLAIYNAEHPTKPADQLEGEIKLRNDVKLLREALQNIVDNWDENLGVNKGYEKEQLKYSEHIGSYWSPASAQINSCHISSARTILGQTK